jgi:diguanylate cyclase (GGDEF)-like protein
VADANVWLNTLEELCSKYETLLHPSSTVEADLQTLVSAIDSPVEAISLELRREQPFTNLVVGKRADGEPTDTETKGGGAEPFEYRVCIWRNRKLAVDLDRLRRLVLRLATAHWKTALHDRVSGLLSFQYPDTQRLLENTIAASPQDLYILFTDLDQFKQLVNDPYGQDGGDQAILQFAALFDAILRPSAVPIHRSGDEFCGVMFTRDPVEALRVAVELSATVKNHVFKIKGHDVHFGITVGLTAIPPGIHAYAEIEDLAVKTIKPPTGKQRGKIRFSPESGRSDTRSYDSESVLLGLCSIKTNIPVPQPFASPALNLISNGVADNFAPSNFSSLQRTVDGMVEATTLNVTAGLIQASLNQTDGPDVTMTASAIDVSLAVAHGLYRHAFVHNAIFGEELELRIDSTSDSVDLLIRHDDKVELLYSNGSLESDKELLKLGGFVTRASVLDTVPLARAALIKIGHNLFSIPLHLFADVIVVDDRPTRGGGLPDFWEATVARLTGLLGRNPNVSCVYVFGDTTYAQNTRAVLEDLPKWDSDAERMAFKTGVSAQAIRDAATRLRGNIRFTSNAGELLSKLAAQLQAPLVAQNVDAPKPYQRSAFLERGLFERRIRLSLSDGCQTATIGEAYPIAVEIVRKTKQSWSAQDESGIQLRELTDFKIVLTDPTRDKVPAFYADEDHLLEAYFSREFLSPIGTFGRVFERTGQIAPILQHLVKTISRGVVPATTRRAILIIPHDDNLAEEVAPLGLVAVRVVPRFRDRRIRFDYSYVWRTVEALVGLPYSLYGSVRFSEHLTDQLRSLLAARGQAVEMGQLSYIAQSLHMFTDEYGQIIARRIVNDATT